MPPLVVDKPEAGEEGAGLASPEHSPAPFATSCTPCVLETESFGDVRSAWLASVCSSLRACWTGPAASVLAIDASGDAQTKISCGGASCGGGPEAIEARASRREYTAQGVTSPDGLRSCEMSSASASTSQCPNPNRPRLLPLPQWLLHQAPAVLRTHQPRRPPRQLLPSHRRLCARYCCLLSTYPLPSGATDHPAPCQSTPPTTRPPPGPPPAGNISQLKQTASRGASRSSTKLVMKTPGARHHPLTSCIVTHMPFAQLYEPTL